MQEITAILIHYDHQGLLQRALISLRQLRMRLSSVIVLLDQGMSLPNLQLEDDILVQFVVTADIGDTINHLANHMNSTYFLFLQHTDYLPSDFKLESPALPPTKMIISAHVNYRNISVYQPLLIRRSLLQQVPYMPQQHLPFKEALLSAWLTKIAPESILYKDGLIKQAMKNNTINTIEKQRFLKKYQLPPCKSDGPTIAVMIANYNMEKYVDNAINSCLLQNEQPDQILIMDDGSTDHSRKHLASWEHKKSVTVFSKANAGKARACNDLLPHVKSDFVLELDADDWLDPDAIATIKHYLVELPPDVSVLYGNMRRWKQSDATEDVFFNRIAKGVPVLNWQGLRNYHFPLGPRTYRTSLLRKYDGFPVLKFADGRLYEDVSVLYRLIKNSQFCYRDFTVYNVRQHKDSTTRQSGSAWHEFIANFHSKGE